MPDRGKNGFVVNHASESADKGQGRTLGDKNLTLNVKHKTDTRTGAQAPGSPEVAKAPSDGASSEKGVSNLGDVKGVQAPGVRRTAQAPTGVTSSGPVSSSTSDVGRGLFSSVRNKVIAGVVGAAVVLGGVGVGVATSNVNGSSAPNASSASSSSSLSSQGSSGVYGGSNFSSAGSSAGSTGSSASESSSYDSSSGEAPKNASQLQDYLKSNGLDVSSDAGRKNSSSSSSSSASSSSPGTSTTSQTVRLGSTGLQVENMKLNRSFSSIYNCDVVSVTGSLRNTSSGSRYNYVTVRLALYDAGGKELGTQSVIFTGVAPGNSQPFNESAFSANPRTVSAATSVKVVDFAAG